MKFVGEIGINHNGKIENVFKIMDKFKFLQVFKLQKLTPHLLAKDKFNAPHPVPKNSFSKVSYGKHKEALELSPKQIEKVHAKAIAMKCQLAISVFDIPAAKSIMHIDFAWIKIPSCRSNDWCYHRDF